MSRFIDIRDDDLERVSCRAEQLGTSRRRRRENQSHAAMIGSNSHQSSVVSHRSSVMPMLPISAGLPGALVELLRGSPLCDAKVTFAWKAAVGPAFERVTHVKLEHRVLLVETASAQWSKEVMRSSPV